MKQILIKMASAKEHVKSTKLKKEGKNTFSNYDYFTPAQTEKIVSDACVDGNLLCVFNLKRNEHGETGFLTIYDLDSLESIVYEMATGIPEIKATNLAQQLGGCVTYTERYLKMSAFGIIDNSLDFDTTENTKKMEQQKQPIGTAKKVAIQTPFELAMQQLTSSMTLQELQNNWLMYPDFHKQADFLNKKEELKTILK